MIKLAIYVLIGCCVVQSQRGEEVRGEEGSAQRLAAIQLTDITGKSYEPFQQPATKAIALVFVSTDCPIANSFQPELQKLFQQFDSKGIACFLVYCSPGVSVDRVQKHRADFEIKMPCVIDDTQRIGRMTNAKVTPEAIVINRRGMISYRGKINDLYAGYGKKRAQPTVHYLRDALNSLVAGTLVETKQTKPIGCFIRYETANR